MVQNHLSTLALESTVLMASRAGIGQFSTFFFFLQERRAFKYMTPLTSLHSSTEIRVSEERATLMQMLPLLGEQQVLLFLFCFVVFRKAKFTHRP